MYIYIYTCTYIHIHVCIYICILYVYIHPHTHASKDFLHRCFWRAELDNFFETRGSDTHAFDASIYTCSSCMWRAIKHPPPPAPRGVLVDWRDSAEQPMTGANSAIARSRHCARTVMPARTSWQTTIWGLPSLCSKTVP